MFLVEELNGDYFSLKELAKLFGKNYANLSRKVKKLNITDYSAILGLGNRCIVHKKDLPILIKDDRKNGQRTQYAY